MLLRHRHAHGHAKALAQRPGRHFDAFRLARLRMSRRLRVPLPERLQIVERHLVAGEKQRGIQQRRRMSVRQHKAVAIGPLEVRRIVLHQLVIQQVGNRRAAQRSAGMAAIGLLNRVHRKQPQVYRWKVRRSRVPQVWQSYRMESFLPERGSRKSSRSPRAP